MRIICLSLLLPLLIFATPVNAETAAETQSVADLKFSGYRFGQAPAANMTCLSGYCKSQAPGGNGLITFPFSTYAPPGAVSTLAALSVVNPRYTFWDDRLYRIFFQVDCTPMSGEECLDDIVKTLDREYTLTPLTSNESKQFVLDRHVIVKEFATESGVFIKVRVVIHGNDPQMPIVDIVDRKVANQVGSTLSQTYKPKNIQLPEGSRKP